MYVRIYIYICQYKGSQEVIIKVQVFYHGLVKGTYSSGANTAGKNNPIGGT